MGDYPPKVDAPHVSAYYSYISPFISLLMSFRILPLDLTQSEAVPFKVEQATRLYGHIDILILAAGVLQMGHFKDITPDVDCRVMDVNYFGQRSLVQQVLPGDSLVCALACKWLV